MRGAILAIAAATLTTHAMAWQFQEKKDPMGRGDIRIAAVDSTNEVRFSFPYAGSQHGALVLRQSAGDLDVMLQIAKGQFMCGIQTCETTVRFDEGKPLKWSASRAADNSTTVIFLNSERKFLDAARKAKIVRVEATFFQAGSKVFEFDVSGLGAWPAATAKPAAAKAAAK